MGFQSHYGAIATSTSRIFLLTLLFFQSHYGAIATGHGTARHLPFIVSFNPTMVRLQPLSSPPPHMWRGSFQSHYGAIATALGDAIVASKWNFQSHYGAIATCENKHTQINSNSLSIPLWCDCNSHSRLANADKGGELSIPLWCDCNPFSFFSFFFILVPFQSHYGAIATRRCPLQQCEQTTLSIPLWCDCNPSLMTTYAYPLPAFNPTMVRLQRARWDAKTANASGFQSHYGAIATWLILPKGVYYAAFNPTMVRLQRGERAWRRLTFSTFNPTMVRLQHAHCACWLTRARALSIPLWCDCNKVLPFKRLDEAPLSIPLWCDCNWVAIVTIATQQRAFNPTMVRLQPRW